MKNNKMRITMNLYGDIRTDYNRASEGVFRILVEPIELNEIFETIPDEWTNYYDWDPHPNDEDDEV